tara:strand:- start:3186 stop:3614 length:429 start_codon:yes stop_codon:yes gene_type:complete
MSKALYEATLLQLKGKALEAYATLDMLFTNPSAVPDHTEWVNEIVKHTKALAENENTMVTLQQYFGPRFTPKVAPPPPPPPAPSPPKTAEPPPPSTSIGDEELIKRSPTYRKSMETAKLKASIAEKQKKKKKQTKKEKEEKK